MGKMALKNRPRIRSRFRFVLDSTVGERGVPYQCALVIDLLDTYPELERPHVDEKVISFTDPTTGERLTWVTPLPVKKWIRSFDEGEKPDLFGVVLLRKDATVSGSERNEAQRQWRLTFPEKVEFYKDHRGPRKERRR